MGKPERAREDTGADIIRALEANGIKWRQHYLLHLHPKVKVELVRPHTSELVQRVAAQLQHNGIDFSLDGSTFRVRS